MEKKLVIFRLIKIIKIVLLLLQNRILNTYSNLESIKRREENERKNM